MKFSEAKMIVTDLDMTVLRTDKTISDYTRNVFNKCNQKGLITVVATARYYIGAEKYINILNPQYEITTDGAMTYSKGRFIFGTGFHTDTTNSIIQEILRINPCHELTVATDECVYWNSKNIADSPVLFKAVYNDFSLPLSECAYKIVAELPTLSIANAIGEKYGCKIITYRGEGRYGFINPRTGKFQSIHKLARLLNISLCEIIAFGDDLNDIEMLQGCGCGVAVENALPEVKELANYVCKSNENDGVADFIDRNILYA